MNLQGFEVVILGLRDLVLARSGPRGTSLICFGCMATSERMDGVAIGRVWWVRRRGGRSEARGGLELMLLLRIV